MLKRWNQHLQNAKSKRGKGCRLFWNAIRKYGPEAFVHEVLEVCRDLEVANLAEECWIELFDTRNPEKGFNLAKGGQHVPHPTRNPWDRPEYREKRLPSLIAATHTPEAYAKMRATKNTPESRAARVIRSRLLAEDPAFRASSGNHSNKGKSLSEEHRAKIGASNRARSPELVESIAAKLRGRRPSDEERSKISAANRKRCHSEETKRRIAEALARRRSQ
jgi:group I intron endonuclease